MQYLRDKNLPKLNAGQSSLSEKDMVVEEVKHELNKIEIDKSTGNDGLTKEFCDAFRITLKYFSCHLKWLC